MIDTFTTTSAVEDPALREFHQDQKTGLITRSPTLEERTELMKALAPELRDLMQIPCWIAVLDGEAVGVMVARPCVEAFSLGLPKSLSGLEAKSLRIRKLYRRPYGHSRPTVGYLTSPPRAGAPGSKTDANSDAHKQEAPNPQAGAVRC